MSQYSVDYTLRGHVHVVADSLYEAEIAAKNYIRDTYCVEDPELDIEEVSE
jgi:hypothetical protein